MGKNGEAGVASFSLPPEKTQLQAKGTPSHEYCCHNSGCSCQSLPSSNVAKQIPPPSGDGMSTEHQRYAEVLTDRFTFLTTKMDGCCSTIMNTDPTRLCWHAKLSLSPKLSLYLSYGIVTSFLEQNKAWRSETHSAVGRSTRK